MSTHRKAWVLAMATTLLVEGAAFAAAADETKGKSSQAGKQDQAAATDVSVKLATPMDAQQKRTLSTAGVQLLMHVDDARKAVMNKDKAAALHHLDQASTLSKIIQKTAPKYAVNTTLKAGGITYRDQEQIRGTLIPLYDELEKVSFIGPVEAAKRQSAKIAQAGGPTAVTDVDLRRTRLLFDFTGAQGHLDAARQDVNKGTWDRADTELMDVQKGVLFEYIEADVPLMEARQNLALAKVRLDEKQGKEARVALQKASEVIQRYAKAAPESLAKEAREVAGQIDNLAQHADRDLASTGKKIDDLWNRVTSWLG